MITGDYIVRKPFKYNGKDYQPGQVWEPVGGKWDKQIKEYYVTLEAEHEDKTRLKGRKHATRKNSA